MVQLQLKTTFSNRSDLHTRTHLTELFVIMFRLGYAEPVRYPVSELAPTDRFHRVRLHK